MSKPISKNEFLFHPAHGLCRVDSMTVLGDSNQTGVTLRPVPSRSGKIRFVIPEKALEDSGFFRVISQATAKAILAYFKTGKKETSEAGRTWDQAALIRTESQSKEPIKDIRRRQALNQAVYALVREVGFVLKMNLKDVAAKIQEDLGAGPAMNPAAVQAFTKMHTE